MGKRLCILHANCQGEPLLARLMASREFAAEYKCALFTNYTREPVPAEMLARCSLLLHQHLGDQWGDLASRNLQGRLPATAVSLCIPNMFFMGYWPTWSGRPGFNFRCSHLDELIDLGLSPEETTLLYLHADMAGKHDLRGILERTLEQEEHKQRLTPVGYVDLLKGRFGTRRMFNTVNHPGAGLLDRAARGILDHLGLEAPDEAALAALGDPFPEFEQPIHPGVAAFFGWDFAGQDTVYHVFGREMTFGRYVAHYVVARREGVSDFISFLQGYMDE